MFFKFFGTPFGSNPGRRWLLRLFELLTFAAKYQSCQPWYPEKATLSFPENARAILIAIAQASAPVLANLTLLDQGCKAIKFSAKYTSSYEFNDDIFPSPIVFFISSSISSFA